MERRFFFRFLLGSLGSLPFFKEIRFFFRKENSSIPRTGTDLAGSKDFKASFILDPSFEVEEWAWQEKWSEGIRHYRAWCFWDVKDSVTGKKYHFEQQTHPFLGPVRRVP